MGIHPAAGGPGVLAQRLGVGPAEHRLGQVVADELGGIGRVGVAQDEDVPRHPAGAQVQRLGRAAHREPFGPGGLQRLAHHAVGVAVGPRLHHRAHLGGGGVGRDELKVMGEGVQVHLGPAVLFKLQW